MSAYDAILATLVVVLGAGGTYLMLPYRHARARSRTTYVLGATSAGLSMLLFMAFWSPPGHLLATVFFYVFSLAAITAGLLMVTSRNPIYSALWFAAVVLATSGLFLLAGAPFLAAGTVIVYAGAIIVTFLFVIMLAQLEGSADYDRAARAPGRATFTCYLLLWCLIYALSTVQSMSASPPATRQGQMIAEREFSRTRDISSRSNPQKLRELAAVLERASGPTAQFRDPDKVEKPSVAGLGASLYTDHLISAGLAGALLFAALIGAVAIGNPKRARYGRSSGLVRGPLH
jgi:NADH-quinone oxidoreductase subunit J